MEEGMSSMQQKAAELEHMAEVLLTGEQLRLRLHEEKVIKDRRHHLKTYPNCFVAKELIDWLIDHKEASDRETAIKLVQKLLDHSIIHHVCDEHKEFKDVKLFYRFRKDDGTFPLDNEVKVFMRGQRLYEKLMSSENTLLQAREEEGVKYERTFVASEFIDWLIQEGEATTRTEAEQLGRRLLEHGIIQHENGLHFLTAATEKKIPRWAFSSSASLASDCTFHTLFGSKEKQLAMFCKLAKLKMINPHIQTERTAEMCVIQH